MTSNIVVQSPSVAEGAADAEAAPPVKRQNSVVFVVPPHVEQQYTSPDHRRSVASASKALTLSPPTPTSPWKKSPIDWAAARQSSQKAPERPLTSSLKGTKHTAPPPPIVTMTSQTSFDMHAMIGAFAAAHGLKGGDSHSDVIRDGRTVTVSLATDADKAPVLQSPPSPRKARSARKVAERPYYEGDAIERLRNGKGKYYYRNAFYTYEGEWVNGVKHGNGKLSMIDGSSYEGSFENGEISGFGFKRFANGNTYSGQFLNGELNGHGTMIYRDGNKYEGEWKRNSRDGEGVITDRRGNVFDGTFRRNRMNGRGTFLGRNGEFYEGEWRDGVRCGYGRVTLASKAEYEGEWSNGQENGHGTLLHPSGVSYDGYWEAGRPVALATQCVPYVARFEIKHDDMFTLSIECQDDTEETIKQESGRLIRITVVKTEHRPARVDSAHQQRPNTANKGPNAKDKRPQNHLASIPKRTSVAGGPQAAGGDRRTSVFPGSQLPPPPPQQQVPVESPTVTTPETETPAKVSDGVHLDYVPGGFVDHTENDKTLDYFEARTKNGVVIFANVQLSKHTHGETEISIVEVTEPMYLGKRLRPSAVQVLLS